MVSMGMHWEAGGFIQLCVKHTIITVVERYGAFVRRYTKQQRLNIARGFHDTQSGGHLVGLR